MLEDKHRTFIQDSFNPLEIPSAHFQTIHVDLLKFRTPSKGNNFILVIIDAIQNLLSQKQLKRKQPVQ